MTDVMVRSGDAEIAIETFGDRNDPPVLLVMGVMASMLWWPEEFCKALAARGRFVIRYDNRDTGRSTAWPMGAPTYSFADMADDAISILDALDIPAAHVVGMSMGGMIAQRIAVRHPERVLTLTVISSSPLGISDLSSPTETYLKHAESGEAVDWSDRSDVVDFIVRECSALAGMRHPHDAAAARDLIERDFDRARSFASATNHFLLAGGEDGPEPRAADIRSAVLVIHGTSDPLFPFAHGEAFVDAVPAAQLLPIDGGGHELHENDWPVMIDAVVAHTGAQ
jgi:pimeloyl-ACP methyl ester carboxylesterase